MSSRSTNDPNVEVAKLSWQLCADIWRIQHGEFQLGYGIAPSDRERVDLFNLLFSDRFGMAIIEESEGSWRVFIGDILISVARIKVSE
jgi:hypothetical protein